MASKLFLLELITLRTLTFRIVRYNNIRPCFLPSIFTHIRPPWNRTYNETVIYEKMARIAISSMKITMLLVRIMQTMIKIIMWTKVSSGMEVRAILPYSPIFYLSVRPSNCSGGLFSLWENSPPYNLFSSYMQEDTHDFHIAMFMPAFYCCRVTYYALSLSILFLNRKHAHQWTTTAAPHTRSQMNDNIDVFANLPASQLFHIYVTASTMS